MSLLTSACLLITACTWSLKRPAWLTGSERREERKAGVRATEDADIVKSLLAKMGLRWRRAKTSAEALRPCARVCMNARMAGASRSWRSWKVSDPGSLSAPTNPPRNESMTDVVSKPLRAISSESTRYLLGMLARRGDLERRDLSGTRSISSWERRRAAVGIAEWARGTPFAKRGFPGLINFPEGRAPGKSGTDAGAASGWLALTSSWMRRTAVATMLDSRKLGGEVEGRATAPKASSAAVRPVAWDWGTSPPSTNADGAYSPSCASEAAKDQSCWSAGGTSEPCSDTPSHSDPWEESLSDSGAWSSGGRMGPGRSREDPSWGGACWRADPAREGPGVEGVAPPGLWDPMGGTRGAPEAGGWGADPGQKGILAGRAWARPRVASCCMEDSGCHQEGKGCCPWVGHGNPPMNGWGNHWLPQGVADPCGVSEGPHWEPGTVTLTAARGWVVTVAVAAEEFWAVTARGGTTVGALRTCSEAVVTSLALPFGEAGRVAVSLTLRRPPDPVAGDVIGGVLEPPNPSMGELCGGCSTRPLPRVANVSSASVGGEADRVAVALGLREPPDPALWVVSGGLPEPPNPAMWVVCWGGCGSSNPSPKGGAKGVRRPGEQWLSCVLGVFLLLAFTPQGHKCPDCLSPCDGMHVRTD